MEGEEVGSSNFFKSISKFTCMSGSGRATYEMERYGAYWVRWEDSA